jgi:hypothetical protein
VSQTVVTLISVLQEFGLLGRVSGDRLASFTINVLLQTFQLTDDGIDCGPEPVWFAVVCHLMDCAHHFSFLSAPEHGLLERCMFAASSFVSRGTCCCRS